MYSATFQSVTVPVGRERKIWIALRTNQVAGFATMPFEEKIICTYYWRKFSLLRNLRSKKMRIRLHSRLMCTFFVPKGSCYGRIKKK